MGLHWKTKQALRTQLGKACLAHQCGNASPCLQSICVEELECENFLTWTEVDPNNKLSQTARRATWTDMLSNYQGYLYKTRTIDSNFTLELDFRLASIDVNTDTESPLVVGIWVICENSGRMGHVEIGKSVDLWIQESGNSTTKFLLYLTHRDDIVQDISVELDVGVTYYLTITRVGDVYTCKIYSNSSRTTLVDTISIDLSGQAEAGAIFFYVETTGGLFGNYRPNEQTDGFIENLCWVVKPETVTFHAPSTVGPSTALDATHYPFERKSFYANGRFWVFYSDGTNIVYRTSTDGTTWTDATTVRASVHGSYFAIWFDGTYLHYAFAAESTIGYRRGTPNSDGSITWSASEQTVSTTYNKAVYPFVSVDSNGYVWIGYLDYTGTTYYPYVIKSGNNDGTWGTTPGGFPYQLSTTSSSTWKVSVLPLSSGKMYIVYARNNTTVKGRLWNGSMGDEETATSSAIMDGYDHSVVADANDNVYLAFLKLNTYDILHVKRTYGTGWGSEATVKAGATLYSTPLLSLSNTKLYCFWATKTTGSPSGATANHIYYQVSTDGGATWTAMVDCIDESTEILTYANRLTSFYEDYGNNIGLLYMTKTASPYNVRFAYLTHKKEE